MITYTPVTIADSPATLPNPWALPPPVLVDTSAGPVVLEIPAEPPANVDAFVFRLRIYKVSTDTNAITLRPTSPQRILSAGAGADVDLPDSDAGGGLLRSWDLRWALANTWTVE